MSEPLITAGSRALSEIARTEPGGATAVARRIGRSRPHVYDLLRGRARPSTDTVAALLREFGIRAEDWLTEDEVVEARSARPRDCRQRRDYLRHVDDCHACSLRPFALCKRGYKLLAAYGKALGRDGRVPVATADERAKR